MSALADITVKLCPTCRTIKLPAEFYKDKNRPDGLYPSCKSCHNQRTSEWTKNNRERRRELDRIRYHASRQ